MNYSTVWDLLKVGQCVELEAHPNHHKAIRRGIVKRKDDDKMHKYILGLDNKKATLVFNSSGSRLSVSITVSLKNAVSVLDI